MSATYVQTHLSTRQLTPAVTAMLAEDNHDQLTEVSYGHSWWSMSGGYRTRSASPDGISAASILSPVPKPHMRDSIQPTPSSRSSSPRKPSPFLTGPFGQGNHTHPDVPKDVTPNGSVLDTDSGSEVVVQKRAPSLSTSLFSNGTSPK